MVTVKITSNYSNTASASHCVFFSEKGSVQGKTELLGFFHAFATQDINCLLLAYIKKEQTYFLCFFSDVTRIFARARRHTHTHTQKGLSNFD